MLGTTNAMVNLKQFSSTVLICAGHVVVLQWLYLVVGLLVLDKIENKNIHSQARIISKLFEK